VLIKHRFQQAMKILQQHLMTLGANRLVIANRLATERGIDVTNPSNLDSDGYPLGW
jgi:hypothetical protein